MSKPTEDILKSFLRRGCLFAVAVSGALGCLFVVNPTPHWYLICYGLLGVAFALALIVIVRRPSIWRFIAWWWGFMICMWGVNALYPNHKFLEFIEALLAWLDGLLMTVFILRKRIIKFLYGDGPNN